MTMLWKVRWLAMMVAGLAGLATARADVSGSCDGQLLGKKLAQPVAAAAVLKQVGSLVTGTVALGGDPTFSGAYLVQGSATPKRLKLSGQLHGITFTWRAKIVGGSMQGKTRLKGPGTKIAGTLALTLNPPTSDGSSCDPVLAANQAFFVDQVLGQALLSCTACHVTGGQAEATRFRVTMSDPQATARSIAPFVDSASPGTSRILEKPLMLLPHGGGLQLTAGSPEDQTLRQWVGLVAAAHCN